MRRLAWCLVFVGPVWLACGGKTDLSSDDGGTDAAPDAIVIKKDASVVEAGYQPIGKKCDPPDAAAPAPWTPDDGGAALRPPIVASSGGPTLANPVFVTMTFDGDDLRDPLEDFVDSIGCSSYWNAVVPDYGINQGYATTPVHLTDKVPDTIDDTQIGLFIRQKILTKQIPDAVQNQTLYIIYYPDTTDITLQGSHSCQSFAGYHNEIGMADGRTIPYAVLPRCNSGGLGLFEGLTAFTSHEIMEAVTDPFPESKPAYQLPEDQNIAWAFGGGGEVGDLCESNDDSFYVPNDYPFTVQRIWTNHFAFGAHDPCEPSSSTYFGAAPVMSDTLSYDIGFGTQTTTGVALALNASTTINLNLIADGNVNGPISVTVHDASKYLGGNTALTFNLTPQQGNVGDTLQLHITRIGTTPQIGLEPFVIHATAGGTTRTWWAAVGDP